VSKSENKQRWHDNRGELSVAVELLESIPPEILPYIAAGLSDRMDREFNASAILSGLKSLGKDRVMALHQARKKQRSYDQDPHLHQIVNTFLVLPKESQETVAAQFLDFTALMVDYMATCDAFGVVSKPEDLDKMRQYYVETGPSSVKAYIETIHKAYNQIIASEESLPEPNLIFDESSEPRLR
jgi:hypothetical protein